MHTAFALEGLTCARIGQIDDSASLQVGVGGEAMEFWNLGQRPFTGFTQSTPISEEY